MFKRFLNDQTGATSVEYGIIASILSLAIITGVGALAVQLNTLWGANNGAIGNGLK
jgi:pilus assembly protein Flp/PilA